MAFVDGLDIPDELVDLFNRLFVVGYGGSSLAVKTSPSTENPLRLTQWRIRSLMVLWQPIWDAFDTDRRDRWTAYWGTLPFGAHSGAGAWPGSGYSAFIYVNAPRYRVGLDLLLEPPVSNLVVNPDFTDGDTGWAIDAGGGALSGLGHGVYIYDTPAIQQIIELETYAIYRIEFDATAYDPILLSPTADLFNFHIGINRGNEQGFILQSAGHFSVDQDCDDFSDAHGLFCYSFGGVVYILFDNFSVVKL